MSTHTLSTGHEATIEQVNGRWYIEFSGDLDTMDQIPTAEIDAVCAAEGLTCTYKPADGVSYTCAPTVGERVSE